MEDKYQKMAEEHPEFGDQERAELEQNVRAVRAMAQEALWGPTGKSGCLSVLSYIVLLPIACVLPFSPGMLALALFESLSEVDLARGQSWTFSILVTLAILFGLRARISPEEPNRGGVLAKAMFQYCLTSIGILALMGVFYLGFRLNFPMDFLEEFAPMYGKKGLGLERF